jgi:glycerol uptake facilitator-like aquaporin
MPGEKYQYGCMGAVLLFLGICLTAAAVGVSELLAGAAVACTSTLVVSASFLLNLLGLKRNMTNNRVMMFVIGFFFTIINFFVYMYSLIAINPTCRSCFHTCH